MKTVLAILASTIALSAMAADAPKADVKPAAPTVTVTAPAAPNKNETKPVKSEKKVEAKAPEAKQSK
jgi:hypothetical protein